jgi:drug/metabolite transporter (DMT)-like permease
VLEATLLALGSAVLHAGWNLLVKTSDERFLTAWGQFLVGGICFLPVLLFTGLPPADALPFLVGSSLVHVVYVLALVRAYHHGDFSFAYPLARGGGALLAAIGGVAFLGDFLSLPSWCSIGVVVVGLASLVRPSVGMLAIGWSLLTALTIGTYTTLDAAGARRSDSGFGYGVLVVVGAALTLSVVGVARGHGGDLLLHLRTSDRRRVVAGGIASVLAYSMVLAAVRLAPVGYVAALRESSVVLGAAMGWLLLHERLGRARLASSVVVATGLVLLIATR